MAFLDIMGVFAIFAVQFLKKLITTKMNQYETVIIFTPVLSDDDVKRTEESYKDFLRSNGAEIVAEERWGLRQLAYKIKKKSTGIYFVLEWKAPTDVTGKLDIQFNRDENVLRYLTVRLDKYSMDYNDRKRRGEIGRKANAKKESGKLQEEGA